jgi:hypothetical protein
MPKLHEFITIIHKNVYTSCEYVHFTSSFLIYVANKTTINAHSGVNSDSFDLLIGLYSQKVVEKNGNCKELCCKIIEVFGTQFVYFKKSAHHIQLLSKFLDFIDKYDLLKSNTDDLARIFYSYHKYRYTYGIITDIIQILPAANKLTDRFAVFIMNFIEQCKLTKPTIYNEPKNIQLTNACLLFYLNNTSYKNKTKSRVKSFLQSFNSRNSKE